MVLFDQLRISDDGKRMYINVHVNTADYFENIFLESVTILTSDKVLETNPGTPTDDFIYFEKFDSDMKEAALVIDIGSLNAAYNNWNPETQQPINASKPYAKVSFDKNNLSSNLFFVYIKCTEGALVGCPPCTLDELTTLGVTFDENLLFRESDISLNSEVYGKPVLREGKILMELKCSGGIPMWMTKVLSEEHVYKTSFSKYGTAYKCYIQPALADRRRKMTEKRADEPRNRRGVHPEKKGAGMRRTGWAAFRHAMSPGA